MKVLETATEPVISGHPRRSVVSAVGLYSPSATSAADTTNQ